MRNYHSGKHLNFRIFSAVVRDHSGQPTVRGHDPRKEEDMSSFAKGQLAQLGDKLQAAEWTAEDVTNLGQASVPRLIKLRDEFRYEESGIVAAIERGEEIELWLHDGQKTGVVQGWEIKRYFDDHPDELVLCVRRTDLKAIQVKGIEFYRKHFAGKVIFAWGDVQDDYVPYLIEYDDKVVLLWYHLDFHWDANNPALRRK